MALGYGEPASRERRRVLLPVDHSCRTVRVCVRSPPFSDASLFRTLPAEGAALSSMLSRIATPLRTIMAIETTSDKIFDIFASSLWRRRGSSSYGRGDSFLWRRRILGSPPP